MNRTSLFGWVVAVSLSLGAPALAVERGLQPSALTPAVASSTVKVNTTATYGPEMAFDGKSETAWCEGVAGDGVGQWIGLYLGDAAVMGGPQDFVLHVNRGVTRDYESYMSNGRPTKLRVELFADSRLLASTESAVENAFAEITVRNVPAATGVLWVKVTLLAVLSGDREQDTCIGELRPSFGKANPSNVREFAQRVCLMIDEPKTYETNKDLKALVKKITKFFINEFEDNGKAHCDMEFFHVMSATDFELHGAEGGDGAHFLRFRKSGIMWDLFTTSYFTVYD